MTRPPVRFPLGRMLTTLGALEALKAAGQNPVLSSVSAK